MSLLFFKPLEFDTIKSMSSIDRILAAIDEAEPMMVSGDALRGLEDEVWAELSESVDAGYRTSEEATRDFLAWRERYRPIGRLAVDKSV